MLFSQTGPRIALNSYKEVNSGGLMATNKLRSMQNNGFPRTPNTSGGAFAQKSKGHRRQPKDEDHLIPKRGNNDHSNVQQHPKKIEP